MRKKQVWETEDGLTFDTQQEAKSHELERLIADQLIVQLGYKSDWADRIGRDYDRILKIVGACRNGSDNTKRGS